MGIPTGGNSNYTAECFRRWGQTAAMGLSKSAIADLRSDEEVFSIMDALKEFEAEMTEAQSLAWSAKLESLLAVADGKFGEAKASQVAVFMKHFRFDLFLA
jgi:hypothetical protein